MRALKIAAGVLLILLVALVAVMFYGLGFIWAHDGVFEHETPALIFGIACFAFGLLLSGGCIAGALELSRMR
jgi:hypothetical protein